MAYQCIVKDCLANQNPDPHVFFFTFPRERYRQIEWLQAIGRQDLVDARDLHTKKCICSLHFHSTTIVRGYGEMKLARIANPTLHLPGFAGFAGVDDQDPSSLIVPVASTTPVPIFIPAPAASPLPVYVNIDTPSEYLVVANKDHDNVKCNSCKDLIVGYRYKCLTCQNYDLCSKCDKLGAHDEHCLLKIPKPSKCKRINMLVANFQKFLKTKNLTPNLDIISSDDSSDDDNVPITKLRKHDQRLLDISEEDKAKIRAEVTKVLSYNHEMQEKKIKRHVHKSLERYRMKMKQARVDKEIQTKPVVRTEASTGHEVVFADVIDLDDSSEDIKPTPVFNIEPLSSMRLQDELSDLIILNP